MNSLAAIVLAAGKGTRMCSPRSKLLHPLLGEPLVAFPLRALHDAGVRRFVIVVGHEADDVKKAIAAMSFLVGCELSFAVQEPQNGTGHAVQVALDSVASDSEASEWLIACGDSPHLDADACKRLLETRAHHHAKVAVLGANVSAPRGYGRLVCDGHRLERIVEEKDASEAERAITLVNAGAYAVDGAFLKRAIFALEPKNAQKELYLTDIVTAAAGGAVFAGAAHPDVVLGVNSQAELARSHSLLTARIIAEWQVKGVSIEPGDTVIGPRVKLAPGVVLERGVTLLGETEVGELSYVEHHAHLHDMKVGARVRVKAFTYAEKSELGNTSQVGPVSRIRAGSVIEEGAEIGNFCEVKNTRVKKKGKAHHVSYLGDAEIGSNTNIGAGTIICNYDGFSKPFSRIGADVFIGSNSTLVAPVEIADRAYVAAGSVITHPVPEDALAIGRARQDTKHDYAKNLKAKLKARKESKKS
jgi:bifunctional UDP-N-acetylglucosamine pyrophosphorylase / glucosamine-1-phosphate N-acetyltransferase